jgi:hypothetical protein
MYRAVVALEERAVIFQALKSPSDSVFCLDNTDLPEFLDNLQAP